jgi:hypothetical protein
LFLAVSCIERYLVYVAERFEISHMTDQNLEEFKLTSLIILNLASKYYDRVAYSISELLDKLDVPIESILSPMILRQYE